MGFHSRRLRAAKGAPDPERPPTVVDHSDTPLGQLDDLGVGLHRICVGGLAFLATGNYGNVSIARVTEWDIKCGMPE